MPWWMYPFIVPGILVFWKITEWLESIFDRRTAENELREATAKKQLEALRKLR